MRLNIFPGLLIVLIGLAIAQNSERSCPCTYGGIWLDIVAVIDNSVAMTTAGLAQVAASFATVAGQLPVSQSLGQNSRISLVTFNKDAAVVGDLQAYDGPNSLFAGLYGIKISDAEAVNIEAGLQAAGQVLQSSHERSNVKTVIVLFSSAYSSGGFTDPLPVAEQLKEDGTPIITVAFTQFDTSGAVNKIAALASPGFALNSTDNDVINEILAAFCQVNCFCPSSWFQMSDNYDKPSKKFGECLRYQDLEAAWTPAKYACPSEQAGAFLYQEFTQQKHNFVQRLVNQSGTYDGTGLWHIGLSYDGSSGKYSWEAPNSNRLGDYQPWDAGYPQVAYGTVVGMSKRRWENIRDLTTVQRYVCQVATCDTDTYCA